MREADKVGREANKGRYGCDLREGKRWINGGMEADKGWKGMISEKAELRVYATERS